MARCGDFAAAGLHLSVWRLDVALRDHGAFGAIATTAASPASASRLAAGGLVTAIDLGTLGFGGIDPGIALTLNGRGFDTEFGHSRAGLMRLFRGTRAAAVGKRFVAFTAASSTAPAPTAAGVALAVLGALGGVGRGRVGVQALCIAQWQGCLVVRGQRRRSRVAAAFAATLGTLGAVNRWRGAGRLDVGCGRLHTLVAASSAAFVLGSLRAFTAFTSTGAVLAASIAARFAAAFTARTVATFGARPIAPLAALTAVAPASATAAFAGTSAFARAAVLASRPGRLRRRRLCRRLCCRNGGVAIEQLLQPAEETACRNCRGPGRLSRPERRGGRRGHRRGRRNCSRARLRRRGRLVGQ
ncbi:MAG: hypothetical protein H0U56_15820, partial [Methylibium sp.]|nr:hypothetical protein [Methylibium sp.]